MKRGKLIRSIKHWNEYTAKNKNLKDLVIQNIDFASSNINWNSFEFDNTVFINCSFKQEDAVELIQLGAFIYPKFDNLPFDPNRKSLYSYNELLDGYDPEHDNSIDLQIYKHFSLNKYNPGFHHAMAQRLHDFNIDASLRELLIYNKEGMTDKKAVGFMGGHSEKRGSEYFVKVALAAKLLAENGYYIVTGGGPGIMEAANLGAYMAGRTTDNLYTAIDILSDLDFGDTKVELKDFYAKNYILQAQKVLEEFPGSVENLAIPTWFYGHEPTNVFASHIAKYFSNSMQKKYKIGVIPHYVNHEEVNSLLLNEDRIKIINLITDDIENTINEILECEMIISSSLHGIIVSQAYQIPSLWVQFSEKLAGDNVKFYDYFESLGIFYKKEFNISATDLEYEKLLYLLDENKTILLPLNEMLILRQNQLLESCPFKF